MSEVPAEAPKAWNTSAYAQHSVDASIAPEASPCADACTAPSDSPKFIGEGLSCTSHDDTARASGSSRSSGRREGGRRMGFAEIDPLPWTLFPSGGKSTRRSSGSGSSNWCARAARPGRSKQFEPFGQTSASGWPRPRAGSRESKPLQGLARLQCVDPPRPVQRHRWTRPGGLLHLKASQAPSPRDRQRDILPAHERGRRRARTVPARPTLARRRPSLAAAVASTPFYCPASLLAWAPCRRPRPLPPSHGLAECSRVPSAR
jgi:hypothetical protein